MATKVLIAGGGTGGHIYPALAVAQALKEKDQHNQIEFVGTPLGLETKLVPRAGFPLHFVPIGRLNRVSFLERLMTLLKLPLAFFRAVKLLNQLKPDVILGVGGYASGPVVLMAALLRYKTVIWEPNAHPGLANRWLSWLVDRCLVVFDEARPYFHSKKISAVPMPVRKEIESSAQEAEVHKSFHVLLFGGSQGARPLNNVMSEAVMNGEEWLQGLELVHQTGPHDFTRIYESYSSLQDMGDQVEAFEYLHDMPQRYAWADLVIARAGTGTISELAACGKAAILIPLPSAADDHQTKNAEALAKKNAAVLLPQKELTPQRLVQEILKFKSDAQLVNQLSRNIKAFHQSRGAEKIAEVILDLVKEK